MLVPVFIGAVVVSEVLLFLYRVRHSSALLTAAMAMDGALVIGAALAAGVHGRRWYGLAAAGLLPLYRIANLAVPPTLHPVAYYGLTYLMLIAALALFLHFWRVRLAGIGFRTSLKGLPLGVAAGTGLAFLLAVAEFAILGRQPILLEESAGEYLALAAVMLLLVGVGEEVLFRGVLQRAMEPLYGRSAALLFASFIFASMHGVWGSPLLYLFTFAAGLVLGHIYNRTGNLVLVAYIHGMEDVFLFGVVPLLF